jgi:hypothetical protein
VTGEPSWDLDGDGDVDAMGQSADIRYERPGAYRVTMLVPEGDPVSADISVGQLLAPFSTFPSSPLAGEEVLLIYTGPDQGVPIERYDWELDGDGDFDDATGHFQRRAFALPGRYLVGLRVTDKDRAWGIEYRAIDVRAGPVVPTALRLLSPYPVVRITGRVTPSGARIRRLTVLAPVGARITVRCRGRGCPFKQSVRVARRTRPGAGASTLVRFRKMERRLLRGGATIRVYVNRDGWVGKYTRWTIRRSKPPLRRDLCLAPGATTPSACPTA